MVARNAAQKEARKLVPKPTEKERGMSVASKAIESILGPLREQRAQILADLQRLDAERAEARAELVRVDRVLKAAGDALERPAQKNPKAGNRKKASGTAGRVAAHRLDQVEAVVKAAKRPISTVEVAAKVPEIAQSSVSKALQTLRQEGRIHHHGYVPGVRGKRPTFSMEKPTIDPDASNGNGNSRPATVAEWRESSVVEVLSSNGEPMTAKEIAIGLGWKEGTTNLAVEQARDKGMVRIVGQSDAPGKPRLFAATS